MSEYPAVIELSSLDGNNGFKINGEAAGDNCGHAVADAGDVNGDGFADLIVSARGATESSGTTYVIFGGTGSGDTFELSTIDGNNGFKISGANVGDLFGYSVSSAGDMNGDGVDDVIVGAWGDGSLRGAAYVVFGTDADFGPQLNVADLDGNNGFKLASTPELELPGLSSVSSVGDINGDGFDDVAVGAFGGPYPGGGSGVAYVLYGKASGFDATLDFSSVDGVNGFSVPAPPQAGGEFAISVSSAGDVNADGLDDLVVGGPGGSANGTSTGSSYVVFGSVSGLGATFNLSTLDGNNGFRLDGVAAFDESGIAVSSAGDVNADGYDDVLIGAHGADADSVNSGASYVVFGRASGFVAALDLSALDGVNGFRLDGAAAFDYSGWTVSSAGDVNGDGFADVIVGALSANPNGTYSGASYVVFGKALGFDATLELSSLDGTNGFTINGEGAYDASGASVSSAGDVNGDGFDDLIVGAYGADPNGDYSGASYVVYGSMPGEAVTRIGTAIANTIHGGNFRDTLKGLEGDDTLYGHGGADRLIGAAGNDTINGGDGRDWLGGGGGNDDLNGGAGNDSLQGRVGHDTLAGGDGADTLIYRRAFHSTGTGYDKIVDFDATTDRFDVHDTVTGIDAQVSAGALSTGTFDADMGASADTMHLSAHHAVLFAPDSGGLAGRTFLIVDQNGVGGYQTGSDLVIDITGATNLGSLGTEDFI